MADAIPGPLIGSGRAADVYALDGGQVLRRYRTAHSCAVEADLMRYLHEAGYPVPAVFAVDGADLPWWLTPVARGLRRVFLNRFRSAVRDDPRPHLARVARYRLKDPNVRPTEATRLRRLAGRAASGPGS
jgi:hypothetical protein